MEDGSPEPEVDHSVGVDVVVEVYSEMPLMERLRLLLWLLRVVEMVLSGASRLEWLLDVP